MESLPLHTEYIQQVIDDLVEGLESSDLIAKYLHAYLPEFIKGDHTR